MLEIRLHQLFGHVTYTPRTIFDCPAASIVLWRLTWFIAASLTFQPTLKSLWTVPTTSHRPGERRKP